MAYDDHFLGSYSRSTDGQYRIRVPSEYISIIPGSELFIWENDSGLIIGTHSGFIEKIFDENQSDNFYSQLFRVRITDDAKILIPEKFRKNFPANSRVEFISYGPTFLIKKLKY